MQRRMIGTAMRDHDARPAASPCVTAPHQLLTCMKPIVGPSGRDAPPHHDRCRFVNARSGRPRSRRYGDPTRHCGLRPAAARRALWPDRCAGLAPPSQAGRTGAQGRPQPRSGALPRPTPSRGRKALPEAADGRAAGPAAKALHVRLERIRDGWAAPVRHDSATGATARSIDDPAPEQDQHRRHDAGQLPARFMTQAA